MSGINLHAQQFEKLAAMGGEVDSRVILSHTPVQPGHGMQRYDRITAKVVLLIPFTFSGHELCAAVEGEDISTTMRTVARRYELNVIIRDLRRNAFAKAILDASEEIPRMMKGVRPTVSNKKMLRKTRATLNKFDSWGLVPTTKRG